MATNISPLIPNDGSHDELPLLHRPPSSEQPIRLPPMPRRADQMIKKLVEDPLAEDDFHPEGLSHATSIPGREIEYVATEDASLKKYWERQEQLKKETALKQQEKKSRLSPLMSNVSDRSKTSPCSSIRRASWNTSDFPLNETAFQVDELLCLKNLLCPKPNFMCKLEIRNIDLRWLKEHIEDRKTEVPQDRYTLLSDRFETLLVNDPTKYFEEDKPYDKQIISSPRSAVVLLRNGIEAYQLLSRPAKFYWKVGEVIGKHVLQKRRENAEKERNGLLESLRVQYRDICEQISVQDAVDTICGKVASKDSGLSDIVAQRFERDKKAMQWIEESAKKMSEKEMKKREESSRRYFELERVLHEKQILKEKRMEERAEKTRQELAAKKRVLDVILSEKHKIAKESLAEEELKRDALHRRIDQQHKERHDVAAEGSAVIDQRLARSKDLIAQREIERRQQLNELEELKAQRAARHHERLAQEHADLVYRLNRKHAKEREFRMKKDAIQEDLVAKVEQRLRVAEERADVFHRRRDAAKSVAKHQMMERQKEIEFAISLAERIRKEKAERALQKTVEVEEKLKKAKVVHIEKLHAEGEENNFFIHQKQRIVANRILQQQFMKLHSVSRLEEKEGQIEQWENEKKITSKMTMDLRKQLRMRHDEIKQEGQSMIVRQERETAVKVNEITNPKPRFPNPYTHIAARTDYGQAQRRSKSANL